MTAPVVVAPPRNEPIVRFFFIVAMLAALAGVGLAIFGVFLPGQVGSTTVIFGGLIALVPFVFARSIQEVVR